ncbi:MAG: hydrogenase iron-sulfur subunit [Candidatus Dormibacteraeota bacterium]|nr:hydrogenase iron-sulfur subunit [Candidatus Dormibacteraeota bacterium]
MSARTGVYICRGCGIGDSLDVDALAALGAAEEGVAVTRTSEAFCLEDAQLIADDALAQVDRVVVAACSQRVNRQVFRFGATPVRRVNLREQVAWSHPPQVDSTQELAADLLRMGIAAARLTEPAIPYTQDHLRSVLVVGAGPAGLSAALAAGEAGYQVTLVDRAPEAGGFLRRLHRSYPAAGELADLPELDPVALVQRVSDHPNVTLMVGTSVLGVSGQPGRFLAALDQQGQPRQLEAGAVVFATGFEPAPDGLFSRYGLGELEDVITSVGMEDLARQGQILRPSTGAPAQRVVILACDGPGDAANLPYVGPVTSMVALKQAMYVHQRQPQATIHIVFQDMQTPGLDELYYRHVQGQRGIFLVRGEATAVRLQEEGDLAVQVTGSVLARELELRADLVVLQVGMIPTSDPQSGVQSSLHLAYLQGESLPAHRAGFLDSNFLCFPFETRRTGIYTAGCVHRAQDVASSSRDGAAAALKAVQVVEKSAQGAAVHPRVGDLGYPQFFMQKCTACGRCTQECPFGALELDSQRHPVIEPNRCRRCGICMGACPVQVISFPDYSVEMLSAMQKSVEIPEDDDKPRVLVLACENDAYPALDMVGINRLRYPADFRIVPVRCLGSVNSVVVVDAVQRGYDGVVLLGCRSGDNYQCHFIQGSELLGVRMDNVRETLSRLALENDRVQVIETSIADARALPGELAAFASNIAAMGPNPMKGF